MISAVDLADNFAELGIGSPGTLMVHSSVRACLRVDGATPTAKLETIVRALDEVVGDGVLAMPTFTYSFCNGEPFNLSRSPSTVGALTEYFRQLSGVRRTTDPIFSAALRGSVPPEWEESLLTVGDVDCFGERSFFAYLREVNATLLFFGVDLEACTFIHHVEQRHGVDYRYMKNFHGIVEDGEERAEATASYFVRPLDGDVDVFLRPLEAALLDAGLARTVAVPDGPRLLATDARSVEQVAVAELAKNPSFLLRRGHDQARTSVCR